MKIKFKADWKNYYDWVLYPALMLGIRDRTEIYSCSAKWAIGIGFIFLKGKISISLYFGHEKDYEEND